MKKRLILLSGAVLLPAAVPAPRPGEIKIFRDWAVGCDNGKVCTLASLGPTSGAGPDAVMSVTRDAGPVGGWRIVLTPLGDTARAVGVAIDGKRIDAAFQPRGDGAAASGPGATAIVALLGNSRALTLTDAAGARLATLSPLGLSAALRYIDAAQGRVDTVTAVIARGAKPATAVPSAPALPVIAAIRPEGRVAALTPAQAAALARSAKCEAESTPAARAQSFALGAGKALVLVPCGAGAYNLSSAVFVIDRGRPMPARFDAVTGFGERTTVPLVVNAGYAAGTLTSYAKGRGLGDCGTSQSFVWDGTRFRLSAQSAMTDCRGNPEFITIWRASVTRR